MQFFNDAYRLLNKYNQKTKKAKYYGTDDLLYAAEVHMIEVIGSNGEITTTKLAALLGITKGAVSQITNKLLNKTLIVKEASKNRTNEVLISLSEKGQIVYDYHKGMHKDMWNRLYAIYEELSEENRVALQQILQVIDESLDELE